MSTANIATIAKHIDAELLLKISKDSGLLRVNEYNGNLLEEASNEIIFNTAKSIIKDRYPNSVIRKNQSGISITLYTEKITELFRFIARINGDDIRQIPQLSDLVNTTRNPRGSLIVPEVKEDRVVFHLKYLNPNFYPVNLVYSQIFDFIFVVEELERKADEDIANYTTRLEELRERRRVEEQARLEAQRVQREREAEQRRIQQEQQARETEARRVREAEQRAETERVQTAIRRGATENGVNIANRLRELITDIRRNND